ncbi:MULTISPECIES: YihY/virulence factor BrkB family protein [unclassified Yoonia]|uniref:YihY/virulence factor BrkB family protein n=1 Tax=unclassified Yoonia TaxID=2629118 RepID=UPI002AFE04E4|nr:MULTISPECIES: YihY/virulence factor BrkB family protein [unclassified Yoonia]
MAALKTIWQTGVAVVDTAGEKHLGLIAAGVAFFGMFGIFPGLAAIIAIFGLMADPVAIADQLTLMEDIIPDDAYRLLENQINGLVNAPSQALGWASVVSILVALWSCRAAVGALIGGLNAIAGQKQRSGLRQVAVALLLTFALVFLAIIAVNVVIVLPIVMAVLPIPEGTAWLLEGLRWIVALCVLLAALGLLYRFGPVRIESRGRWVTVGALVVIVLWIAASAGLSFYLTNFASYNEVYGSIGAVIGMMLWLYVSAYLILLGAALNMHVHGRRAKDAEAT